MNSLNSLKGRNLTMLVDFYEMTMANGYLKNGMAAPFRRSRRQRRHQVPAGARDCALPALRRGAAACQGKARREERLLRQPQLRPIKEREGVPADVLPMSGLMREQLREPPALRALVALDVELGIDLVYILLDAALGEKQLFRDLPVRQPLCHQADQRIFPLRQRGERCGADRPPRTGRGAARGSRSRAPYSPARCPRSAHRRSPARCARR